MPDFACPPGWTADPQRLLLHKTALAIMKSLNLDYPAAVVAAEQARERLAKLPPITPKAAPTKAAPAKLAAVAASATAQRFYLAAPLSARGGSAFGGIAYSGGVIPNFGPHGDAAIDLSMLAVDGRVPALFNHDPAKVAGFAVLSNLGTHLAITEGTLSRTTPTGKEIAGLLQEGQPFMLSLGINGRPTRADAKKPTLINGKSLRLDTVFHDARLLEISFVPAGADPSAFAHAA